MTKSFKCSAFYDRNDIYRQQNRKSFRTHFRVIVSLNNVDGLEDDILPTKGRYGKNGFSLCTPKDYDNSNPTFFAHTPKDVVGNKKIMQQTKEKFYHNTRLNKIEESLC